LTVSSCSEVTFWSLRCLRRTSPLSPVSLHIPLPYISTLPSKLSAHTRETGILPGRGQDIWRDWYSHAIVNQETPPFTSGSGSDTVVVDLDAPLGHIPVLVRSGAALLLHSQPGYTTRVSASLPYALLVSLSRKGNAYGNALVDDGETDTAQSRTLVFNAHDKTLEISTSGEDPFEIVQPLGVITVLGIDKAPKRVRMDGKVVPTRKWVFDSTVQRLVISGLSIDLNERCTILWG
jgi:alpha-glucosidase